MSNTKIPKPKKHYEPLKYMLNRDDKTDSEEEESESESDEESEGSSTVPNHDQNLPPIVNPLG